MTNEKIMMHNSSDIEIIKGQYTITSGENNQFMISSIHSNSDLRVGGAEAFFIASVNNRRKGLAFQTEGDSLCLNSPTLVGINESRNKQGLYLFVSYCGNIFCLMRRCLFGKFTLSDIEERSFFENLFRGYDCYNLYNIRNLYK